MFMSINRTYVHFKSCHVYGNKHDFCKLFTLTFYVYSVNMSINISRIDVEISIISDVYSINMVINIDDLVTSCG